MDIYDFDYDKYPDGISDDVEDLDSSVWDRGYKCETDEGTWYEVYVTDDIKDKVTSVQQGSDAFDEFVGSLLGLYADDYEDYGQLTFFVPYGESDLSFENLTQYFLSKG